LRQSRAKEQAGREDLLDMSRNLIALFLLIAPVSRNSKTIHAESQVKSLQFVYRNESPIMKNFSERFSISISRYRNFSLIAYLDEGKM